MLLLVPVVVLAAFLRLWRLDEVGFGNLYYAATVRSMLTGPANFLYASFDPAGFVTVDKPPVGFWVQAGFAAVLGYSGIALVLPQAIAGIAAVPLLYVLVARTFGTFAGLAAALVLAITPVSVAVDRNNTVDAQLTLVLLAATYAALRASERADLRWLLAAGALVGLGFNVKMAQAFLPLPALALTYFVAAPAGWRRRIVHLAGFATVTLAVSLAWIAVVDLTPSSQRPFVGSSANDSALGLAIGHNGLARLGPLGPALGLVNGGPGSAPPPGAPRPPAPAQPLPPGGGPQAEVGERGALRLFNPQLAGQVSWFIPLAIVGALAAVRRTSRPTISAARRDILLWTAWLVPAAVLISYGGIIHRYYLVMLAAPVAALCGIGARALFDLRGMPAALALLAAVALTSVVELNAVGDALARWPFLPGLIGTAGALGILAATAAVRSSRAARAVSALSCALLLVAPFLWATTPLDGGAAGLPYASPELLRGGAGAPGAPGPAPGGSGSIVTPARPPVPGMNDALLRYLLSERRGETFVVAGSTAGLVAPVIVVTGEAAMAIGGFSGSDPILDRASFRELLRDGTVRFVFVDERLRTDLRELVTSSCSRVPDAAWRDATPAAPAPPRRGPPLPPQPQPRLYDCGALRV